MRDIAICVAVITLDESGELVIAACNDEFLQLMGRCTADNQSFPIAFEALLADSARREFFERLRASFASARPEDMERTHDIREGTDWWRLSLKPLQNANNCAKVREILVTGFSLTAKMDLMQEPDVSASRYRALVDLAYDAIVTMDSQHNITLFNRAAENLFGYSAAEVLGLPIVTLLPERFRASHPRKVQDFADSHKLGLRQAAPPRMDDSNSVYGQHRDGSVIPVEIAISKIDSTRGTEFMAVVRDITDRARLMDVLKKQAATDVLTGLPNRREFLKFTKKVIATNDLLSVFILDVDFFKEINDEHGHDAGDEVLRVLAKIGESMSDGLNLFARWGGEEFAAALSGADENRAYMIAEQIRERCERQAFDYPWCPSPTPFTVSIGVVTREVGEVDVDELMRRADRALYRAKRSGRNRVEVG